MSKLDEMTLGEIKEAAALLSCGNKETGTLNNMVGKDVIIRTYSAGCWFGRLEEKAGNEVILADARRMWRWWAADGISLSACALHGIKHDKSKIVEAVPSVWLEAIEIIPCSPGAIDSIKGAPNVQAG